MLTLVSSDPRPLLPAIAQPQALLDHQSLLESFFQTCRIRNFSQGTIDKYQSYLTNWFKTHGSELRPLFTWEAMLPVEGRKRMQDYGATLIESGITSPTIRMYLGILKRYFNYILEHPFLHTPAGPRRIQDLYYSIELPITEYDMPNHVYDDEQRGIPIDPERIYEFYAQVQRYYLTSVGSYQAIKARNYTLLVLAAESGLRINELLHLEISKDLFF